MFITDRRKANNIKVLVSSLAPKFDTFLNLDSDVYAQYYLDVKRQSCTTLRLVWDSLSEGFDIVHMFAEIQSDGRIVIADGTKIEGTEIIQRCCKSGVKLLWIANSNPTQSYLHGFKLQSGRLNLVMTIDRKGDQFVGFLTKLLTKLKNKESLPTAWASLAPQDSRNPKNIEAPQMICAIGWSSAEFA